MAWKKSKKELLKLLAEDCIGTVINALENERGMLLFGTKNTFWEMKTIDKKMQLSQKYKTQENINKSLELHNQITCSLRDLINDKIN
jgi:hypothetical protein